jgi:hypothetical protein
VGSAALSQAFCVNFPICSFLGGRGIATHPKTTQKHLHAAACPESNIATFPHGNQ